MRSLNIQSNFLGNFQTIEVWDVEGFSNPDLRKIAPESSRTPFICVGICSQTDRIDMEISGTKCPHKFNTSAVLKESPKSNGRYIIELKFNPYSIANYLLLWGPLAAGIVLLWFFTSIGSTIETLAYGTADRADVIDELRRLMPLCIIGLIISFLLIEFGTRYQLIRNNYNEFRNKLYGNLEKVTKNIDILDKQKNKRVDEALALALMPIISAAVPIALEFYGIGHNTAIFITIAFYSIPHLLCIVNRELANRLPPRFRIHCQLSEHVFIQSLVVVWPIWTLFIFANDNSYYILTRKFEGSGFLFLGLVAIFGNLYFWQDLLAIKTKHIEDVKSATRKCFTGGNENVKFSERLRLLHTIIQVILCVIVFVLVIFTIYGTSSYLVTSVDRLIDSGAGVFLGSILCFIIFLPALSLVCLFLYDLRLNIERMRFSKMGCDSGKIILEEITRKGLFDEMKDDLQLSNLKIGLDSNPSGICYLARSCIGLEWGRSCSITLDCASISKLLLSRDEIEAILWHEVFHLKHERAIYDLAYMVFGLVWHKEFQYMVKDPFKIEFNADLYAKSKMGEPYSIVSVLSKIDDRVVGRLGRIGKRIPNDLFSIWRNNSRSYFVHPHRNIRIALLMAEAEDVTS